MVKALPSGRVGRGFTVTLAKVPGGDGPHASFPGVGVGIPLTEGRGSGAMQSGGMCWRVVLVQEPHSLLLSRPLQLLSAQAMACPPSL